MEKTLYQKHMEVYDILTIKNIQEIKTEVCKMFDDMWDKLQEEADEKTEKPINLSVSTNFLKRLISQIELAEELSTTEYRVFHKLD